MKFKLLIILSFVLSISAFTQQKAIEKMVNKYSEKEGFSTVYISNEMIKIMSKDASKDKDFSEAINGLTGITIISVTDTSLNKKLNFYDEIINDIPMDEYFTFMTIKEKNQKMKMLVKGGDEGVSEFLMIGGGNDNFIIYMTGNVNLNSIQEITDGVMGSPKSF